MQMKKGIALLAGMMMVTGLTACNSESGNNASSSSSSPASSEASAKPGDSKSTKSSIPEMDFDMGGKKIKIVSWWDMAIPEDNPDNIAKKKNLEELMKKHNFKVEYITVDYGEYQEKITTSLISGEPIGDIIRVGKNYTIPALVKLDLLWPVGEYTKDSKILNQKANEFMTYNGKTYGFTEQSNATSGVFYNRTLMEKLGLKPLQEYVDGDKWDWDTFIKVAKEANKDTNNDGKVDTWGLAQADLMQHALVANEASLTLGDKQNLDDPKTVEALNFLSRIATEKAARPSEGGDWREPGQFFRQGNTLMYAGHLYEASGLKTDLKDYDIGFLPFPKGPSVTAYHSVEGAFQTLAIPKKVDHPERLVYIWEKIHEIDSMYDYPDQATLESNFTDENDIKNARKAGEGMRVLDHGTFMPNLPYYEFTGEILNGTSVSTVIEKYKATFQSAIDEVYRK